MQMNNLSIDKNLIRVPGGSRIPVQVIIRYYPEVAGQTAIVLSNGDRITVRCPVEELDIAYHAALSYHEYNIQNKGT